MYVYFAVLFIVKRKTTNQGLGTYNNIIHIIICENTTYVNGDFISPKKYLVHSICIGLSHIYLYEYFICVLVIAFQTIIIIIY